MYEPWGSIRGDGQHIYVADTKAGSADKFFK